MAFHVRNKETERLTRELAPRTNLGLTEAVHRAVEFDLARLNNKESLWDRTASLREDVRRRMKHPAPVDKAFRDGLYD